MNNDVSLITGPMSQGDIPGAVIPGSRVIEIGCLGDRNPLCPTIGEELSGDPTNLLSKVNMSMEELGELVLCGFSAGGSVIKRLLTNPAYRELTTAVLLADASYTSSWDDPVKRIPPVIGGFLEYAVDVARSSGDKLFVATASINPNKDWASGIQNLQRLRRAIEEQTERSFQRIDHLFGVTSPAGVVPEAVWKLGNVVFAEFSGKSDFGHAHYRIQPKIWQRILLPWLEQGKGIIGSSAELSADRFAELVPILPFFLGLVGGFWGAQALIRNLAGLGKT